MIPFDKQQLQFVFASVLFSYRGSICRYIRQFCGLVWYRPFQLSVATLLFVLQIHILQQPVEFAKQFQKFGKENFLFTVILFHFLFQL